MEGLREAKCRLANGVVLTGTGAGPATGLVPEIRKEGGVKPPAGQT